MISPRKPYYQLPRTNAGRLPRREDMTLCIAAQCSDEDEVKVVLAADFAVESDIATAEIETKVYHVAKEQYPALIAGSGSRARELITYIGDLWDAAEEGMLFLQACRDGVTKQKHALANEYVSAMLGVTYSDLLQSIHASIPEGKYLEMISDIANIRLGCDLIICQFQDSNDSLIVRVNGEGMAEVCNHFAAVGSGAYIAEASLFQRSHSQFDDLADTIYHVYEAMRLGSYAPGVGKEFRMHIARYTQKRTEWHDIRAEYQAVLEKEFRKFGPKKIKDQVLQKKFVTKAKPT